MRFFFIFSYFILSIVISGCFQSTAMVGPAFTLVSTGNPIQAGLSYSANKVIEDNTGKTPTEHLMSSIEEKKVKNNQINNIEKAKEDFIILVKTNFEKTRKKLITTLKDSNLLN